MDRSSGGARRLATPARRMRQRAKVMPCLWPLAVILWLAGGVCLLKALVDDAGTGYAVGYIVLQGLSFIVAAWARKRRNA
jgi:uncharacterized membrane-anchored protein